MPNKKKKYNARFPPARIKKIMQTDEDVGKVAAAVPVIISRALELFIESLIMKASQTTQTRHAKTLTTAHIKQTIEAEKKFDFLRDLVVNITDHQTEEEPEGNGPGSNFGETGGNKKLGRPPGGSRGPRKRKDSATSNLSSSSDNNNIRRRSKHREEEEEEEEEEDNNNDNEETDDAESEEDQEQHDEDIQDQNNQTTTEEEEATTSSCLRGEEEEEEEESPVPSSNGFPPTSAAPPPGHHSLGQPSSQFKVPPALFSTTSLSRMFLPPGQTQGQQEEDDDYDT